MPSLVIQYSGDILALGASLLHVAGAGAAVHVLMCGRTSQGTIAWMLSLVVLPYLALPLYLIVGGHKFRAYVDAKRAHKATLHALVHGLLLDEAKGATAIDCQFKSKNAATNAAGAPQLVVVYSP